MKRDTLDNVLFYGDQYVDRIEDWLMSNRSAWERVNLTFCDTEILIGVAEGIGLDSAGAYWASLNL